MKDKNRDFLELAEQILSELPEDASVILLIDDGQPVTHGYKLGEEISHNKMNEHYEELRKKC